ncbi:MAG: hypothetical protein K2X03_29695 [Bryobacteraceae bacterium]|nr:hypothetical protein [Bryobacteraceae bacterium]
MKDEKEFKVSASELRYLQQTPFIDKPLKRYLESAVVDLATGTLFLDRLCVDRLREALTIHLANVGFDIDYSVSEEGRQIEDLIDRLYLN